MLKDRLWDRIRQVEVVCRLTLTYLVRDADVIPDKRRRDRGVEYWLSRWYREGALHKHRVGSRMAYYPPTGKRGIRANLPHDLLAGLAAAKLYADLKGRTAVSLSRRSPGEVIPDWTLTAQLGGRIFYYLELHSRRNSTRNLVSKLEDYHRQLGKNEWVLVVSETPRFVALPSDRFMLARFDHLLDAGNAWKDAIWHWGEHDGKHSILAG